MNQWNNECNDIVSVNIINQMYHVYKKEKKNGKWYNWIPYYLIMYQIMKEKSNWVAIQNKWANIASSIQVVPSMILINNFFVFMKSISLLFQEWVFQWLLMIVDDWLKWISKFIKIIYFYSINPMKSNTSLNSIFIIIKHVHKQ